MNNQQLRSRYLQALSGIDVALLDERKPKGLSGVFLPSVSADYASASQKIMVVGRETKGWPVQSEQPFSSLEQYIDAAMSKHGRFLAKQITRPTNDKSCSFLNFLRDLARKTDPNGIVWANLYCFDWKRGFPGKNKQLISTIKRHSEALLKAQIETLAPDIIIFANGATSVPFRREIFPIKGDNNVCINPLDYTDSGIHNHQLWEFDLKGTTKCFRIQHPSSISRASRQARAFLVDLISNRKPPQAQ